MKNKINKLSIGLGSIGLTTTALSLASCSCGPTQFVAYLANPVTDGFTISNTKVTKGESFSTIIKSTSSEIHEDSVSNVIIASKVIQSSEYTFEQINNDYWKLSIDGKKVTGDICITMKSNAVTPTDEYTAYLANPVTDGFTISNTKVTKGESFSTIINSSSQIHQDYLVNVIVAGKAIQSTDYSFEPSNDDGWKLTIENGEKVTGDICITMKSNSVTEVGTITESITDRCIEINKDTSYVQSFGMFKIDDSLVQTSDDKVECFVFLNFPSLNNYCIDNISDGTLPSVGFAMNETTRTNMPFTIQFKELYLNFYVNGALYEMMQANTEYEVKINIYYPEKKKEKCN